MYTKAYLTFGMCVAVPMFHSIFSMSEDILPLIMSLGMIDDHQNTFRTRIWFYCSLVCLFAYVFLYILFCQHYHDDICACNIIIYKCSMQISLSNRAPFSSFITTNRAFHLSLWFQISLGLPHIFCDAFYHFALAMRNYFTFSISLYWFTVRAHTFKYTRLLF